MDSLYDTLISGNYFSYYSDSSHARGLASVELLPTNSSSRARVDYNIYTFNQTPSFKDIIDMGSQHTDYVAAFYIYLESDHIYIIANSNIRYLYGYLDGEDTTGYSIVGEVAQINWLIDDCDTNQEYFNAYLIDTTFSRTLSVGGNDMYYFDYANNEYARVNNDVYGGYSAYTLCVQNDTSYEYAFRYSLDVDSGNAFQRGYDFGFSNGYDVGYGDGAINDDMLNAFDYIGQAVSGVSQILNIPILPGMTIGLLITIPATIGIIAMIFRIIKK